MLRRVLAALGRPLPDGLPKEGANASEAQDRRAAVLLCEVLDGLERPDWARLARVEQIRFIGYLESWWANHRALDAARNGGAGAD